MALSYVKYSGNGTLRDFAVPFPYLSRSHVSVLVNSAAVAFAWTNEALIKTNTAPASGATVTVIRATPSNALLSEFQDGSTLTKSDLDIAALQTIYIAQETADYVEYSMSLSNEAVDTANGAVATANTALATANSANSKADAAVATVDTANATASAANTTAAAANIKADNAVATAGTASETAVGALELAESLAAAGGIVPATSSTVANLSTFPGSTVTTALDSANTRIGAAETTVASHTTTLASHTATLSSHTAALASQATTLASQAATLANQGDSIDELWSVGTFGLGAGSVSNLALADIPLQEAIGWGMRKFELTLWDITPAVDGSSMLLHVSTNNGASFNTDGWRFAYVNGSTSVTAGSTATGSGSNLQIMAGMSNGNRSWMMLRFVAAPQRFMLAYNAATYVYGGTGMTNSNVLADNQRAVNAIRLQSSNGTLSFRWSLSGGIL